jgi:hypothetical protein
MPTDYRLDKETRQIVKYALKSEREQVRAGVLPTTLRKHMEAVSMYTYRKIFLLDNEPTEAAYSLARNGEEAAIVVLRYGWPRNILLLRGTMNQVLHISYLIENLFVFCLESETTRGEGNFLRPLLYRGDRGRRGWVVRFL